ncbi:MAG TPA: xanthine dehydrogenase family protein molybdopterin-binding subunit [Pseudolabrys sp.]|nr:xanthine dehydrogenase family protein molybdopterin-binding subunit [Pseudolabrys sp.]
MESTAARNAGSSTWTGRIEDDALLRGAGRFGDDVKPEGALAAYFVRSPHAFASIGHIDIAAAKSAPGVVAVLTAADLAEAHYHTISHPHPMPGRGGKVAVAPHRPSLAEKRVLHVGEPIALVVAVNAQAAQDAGEKIVVDYRPLTPVIDVRAAIAPGAPQLWPEAPGNIGFDWAAPADPDGKKQAALERAFKDASHVARVELVNQRLVVASLEPRTATARYDAGKNQYTLRCGTQGVAAVRGQIAGAMGIKPEELRILTEDLGGGFGMKAWCYPEYIPILHAARVLNRTIHWASTRSEAFVSDNQGRDSVWSAELALNKRGRFLALRVHCLGNVGAYFTGVAHFVFTTHVSGCLPTVYDIPLAQVNSRCVLTNTLPTGPYRGAGRPEASYLLERLIDVAADKTGIDAAELRRRNLIQPDKIPYITAFGNTYDSGDFPGVFERALILADYADFAARRKAAKKAGRLRGIGIGCYLEIAGAFPEEAARMTFPGGNKVNVSIGAGASGQGHATVFGRVAARRLGVAPDAVTITSGDSARDVPGFGAVASRSAMMVGGAIARTADLVLEKGKRAAAMLLQAAEDDIDFRDGKFNVRGSGREVSLFEVAERAAELARTGVIPESLDTQAGIKVPPSFPNGCHVAEIEIDPSTGAVSIVSYVAVGDCGNVLDETIVAGQMHGGVAQGLGQALTENTIYDSAGQLVSGSFMDYALPRAALMPDMTVEHRAVACRTNPLGVKGTGEAGTTAAPPALINAILDALPSGARLDMPATSERIWQALQAVSPPQ